ncbi:MAG: hypothetical protein OXD49_03240 [Candidatus Poribacteria bacterium]|nr:hypothetical protein [Candidatus Poribacteria bacterium]
MRDAGYQQEPLYYQPKIDPSEEVLRTEIEAFAAGIRHTGIGVSQSSW